MATYGFLDVLQEELDKNFPFDYEISWDKRNHAVEVSFLLEAQNAAGVEMVDEDGEVSSDDILFEEAVLFYNPAAFCASNRKLTSTAWLRLSQLISKSKGKFFSNSSSKTSKNPYVAILSSFYATL